MNEHIEDIHEETFVQGQKAVAKKIAAELFKEEARLAEESVQVACEVVDLAERIAADGNPHKRQIAEILMDGLTRALKTMQKVGDGELSTRERRAAIEEARPFSAGSPPFGTPSPSGQLPASELKALPHEGAKRRRGRPPGTKNRPKEDRPDKP